MEVFVGGLAPDVSDQAVLKAFTRGEQLTESLQRVQMSPSVYMPQPTSSFTRADSLVPRALHVSRHPRTQKCKGFGFVQFGDQASADAACGLISEVGP